MTQLLNAIPGALAQGLIWGVMAIGVYITYKVLDIADLTVDGSLCTGAAVCTMLLLAGHSPWIAMLCAVLAGLLAALFGVIIGIPALRLRGDYLAIITLGFGEIIRVLANADFLKPITNGAMGLGDIPTLYNRRTSPAGLFVYAFIIMVLVIVINFSFGRSRHGRAVIAIREDEIAAESAGVNTTYYKLFAFVLAAFIAGVAGGLYANQIQVIDPAKFDFNRSVEILIMVVLGGMGSITGSIISATVLTVLPEMLRGFDEYRMLLYSIILIAVMLFKPSGLLGRYEISVPGLFMKLWNKLKHPKQKTTGEA